MHKNFSVILKLLAKKLKTVKEKNEQAKNRSKNCKTPKIETREKNILLVNLNDQVSLSPGKI